MQWVAECTVGRSSDKAVLVALANYHHDKTGECRPGIDTLAGFTELNRKTVMPALDRLREAGFIDFEKGTRRHRSYVLNFDCQSPKTGTIVGRDNSSNFGTINSDPKVPKTDPQSPKSGTIGTESKVPNPASHSPKSCRLKSQQLDHEQENGKEQEKIPPYIPPRENDRQGSDDEVSSDLLGDQSTQGSVSGKPPRFVAAKAELPDEIDRENWERWCAFRSQRRKPVTLEAAKLAIPMLAKYSTDVQRKIVTNSIQNDYQGLFEPKGGTDAGNPAGRNPEADRRSKAERIRDEIFYGSF